MKNIEKRHILTEIAKKYTLSVPRYTSYPTAVQFNDTVNADTYKDNLKQISGDQSISLYFHIPFCAQMCWYCGCHTQITQKQDLIDKYINALCLEIQMVSQYIDPKTTVSHIHFGGGTPNALSVKQMQKIMEKIELHFNILPNAEKAIELDPRTLSDDMMKYLAEAGINRVSLGIQDFDPEVQEAIHRVQPYDQVAKVVQKIRDNNIDKISFDLIYGLPKQNTDKMADTLKKVDSLSPDRISVFGYAHVPWMKSHQKMIKKSPLPSPTERLELWAQISTSISDMGYNMIGIDHFARPDDDLSIAYKTQSLYRNFQGYTTDKATTLIGFGSSSIGYLPNGYVQNTTDIPAYQKTIADNNLPIIRGVVLTEDDKERASIIENIMCYFESNVPPNILEQSMPALSPYINDGVICVTESTVKIVNTEFAPVYARLIASCFDIYLQASAKRYSQAI